jgi:hypothetical protein
LGIVVVGTAGFQSWTAGEEPLAGAMVELNI